MKNHRLLVLIALAFLTFSCGGATSIQSTESGSGISNDNSINSGTSSSTETDAPTFSGKVVVKFKDGTGIRLNEGENSVATNETFKSLSGKSVSRTNETISRIDGRVSRVSRVVSATEEEVTEWRENWASRGVELHDWNLAYYLSVADEEDAKNLIEEFKQDENVEYAEILPIFYLANVTTQDLSGEQGYLKSASQGGLGVEDAWANLDALFPGMKLRGQNTMIIDEELDWNFDHEILPIDETEEFVLGYSGWLQFDTEFGKDVPANIHHGTAVIGVLAAQGETLGKSVRGIVPNTKIKLVSATGAAGTTGGLYAEDLLQPGSIVVVEVQRKGITTGAAGCSVGDGTGGTVATGCVPMEAGQLFFDGFKDSTAIGTIVVEGAGNGSIDLNNDNLAAPYESQYFSHYNKVENGVIVNDSGAIMVGASLGADKRKTAWTNCGDRVDLYAWGAGVVTSGYGDRLNPDNVDVDTLAGADNPKLYTGQFGGTSAATAQVAGVAALVQSYLRQLVYDAGYNGKTVYLDSRQMRQILKESGQPAVYGQTPNDPNPNCNIGVQPDAALAMQKLEDFLDAGNVLKVVPLNKDVVSGIRLDIDGDGRADLISFGRDHKWFVDLSSVGNGGDNFGAWDMVFQSEFEDNDTMLFPVVHDYNSDGLADLAIYDSINGKWYIKYTNRNVIENAGATWQSAELIDWDRVIDYSANANWKAYSRPLVQDVNVDKWADLVLQSPDGYWLVDFGGFDGVKIVSGSMQFEDRFGEIDEAYKYLSDTELSEAPGWAWLPTSGSDGANKDIAYAKTPDGITNENYSRCNYIKSDNSLGVITRSKEANLSGDNDSYFIAAGYSSSSSTEGVGFKYPNGDWNYVPGAGVFKYGTLTSFAPQGYGDIFCRPVPADYDGDKKDDRAVQCGTQWKIAYSSQPDVMKEFEEPSIIVNGQQVNATDALPGVVYHGGVKYMEQVELFQMFKNKLSCTSSSCNSDSTIFEVTPPIGPYFAECVKYWAQPVSYCWDK